MKVNYPEIIEDTVTELKIIMSQQRTGNYTWLKND
jgi:hypothetical protein